MHVHASVLMLLVIVGLAFTFPLKNTHLQDKDLDEPKEDHSLSVSSNALKENLQPIPALNRQSTENVEKSSNPGCDRSWSVCSDESDTDVEEPQQTENLNDFPNRENAQDEGNIAK